MERGVPGKLFRKEARIPSPPPVQGPSPDFQKTGLSRNISRARIVCTEQFPCIESRSSRSLRIASANPIPEVSERLLEKVVRTPEYRIQPKRETNCLLKDIYCRVVSGWLSVCIFGRETVRPACSTGSRPAGGSLWLG